MSVNKLAEKWLEEDGPQFVPDTRENVIERVRDAFYDCADDLEKVARTAWRPVSEPPEYELIRGYIHPWVLWLEEADDPCPQRIGAQSIGDRFHDTGWWAWPSDVILLPRGDSE